MSSALLNTTMIVCSVVTTFCVLSQRARRRPFTITSSFVMLAAMIAMAVAPAPLLWAVALIVAAIAEAWTWRSERASRQSLHSLHGPLGAVAMAALLGTGVHDAASTGAHNHPGLPPTLIVSIGALVYTAFTLVELGRHLGAGRRLQAVECGAMAAMTLLMLLMQALGH